MIRRIVLVLVVVLAVCAGLLFYLLEDANRLKPQLEALLAEQTGVPLRIQGDLSWRLFPPLSLSAKAIVANYEEQAWSIGELALDLDMMTVLRTRDFDRWRVHALRLRDVAMLEDGDRLRIFKARLRDFSLGVPSPLTAELDYTPNYAATDATPVAVTLDGMMAYHADPQRIELTDTTFDMSPASGLCTLTLWPVTAASEAPPEHDDDLVNVSTLRSLDWQGQCQLDRLEVAQQHFEPATVTLMNKAGVVDTVTELPQFFGGTANLRLVVDASRTPVRWQITPKLTDVDSERFMAWLDQNLEWAAPLAYAGTVELTGNTEKALIASMRGETTFDAGQGTISITEIKRPLLTVATLLKEPERISQWPDLWDYERLTGRWRINGSQHQLDLALDNLTISANGTYDVLQDQMDMVAELQFATLPSGKMFDVNPLLRDLPIPVHCVGSAEKPSCRLAADAGTRIVAQVLTSDKDSALRAKAEQKIDEKVPEQYRDAARGLLDLLGGPRSTESQER